MKKLANHFTGPSNGMLKVQHDNDTHHSRTSLASIFEDLASIRKSILGSGSHENSSQRSWIERTFMKRECSKFIRSSRDAGKCCCGRPESWQGHIPQALGVPLEERWHPYRHTEAKPTDAYGVLEFQGAPHPSKAQYVRLSSYDSKADQVLQLLQNHWGLDLPKLLITVHGGILNFDLQPKLKRVFRKGLLKAAKTTGAWIVTGGTNTGVTRHVGDAISDRSLKAKNKIIAIGIAPWGVVENKDDLVGKDVIVPYHCVSSPKTNYSVLNNNHSYFLLVDNGTVGKYGGEIIFRKRLEKYIAHQKISNGVKGRGVPVICVVLEGGANTIRSVLEYVTDSPPVPVVVCDGSGRAADLLAFTHKYSLEDGTMPESLRDQLILTIQKTFQYTQEQAEKLFIELMLCVKKRELITVFRMGEGAQDIDLAILTALLKGTNASAPDQLSLALTWDRVDIARSHIFVYGQEWPEGSLEQAMMDALINDRVDFVKLLLENGVHMQSFLTIPRLEELYNTRQGPSNTLRYLVRDVRKHLPSGYRYTLLDIGLVIQHVMGGAFRALYCRKRFRQKYNALKRTGTSAANLGQLVTAVPTLVNTKQAEELFPYPFHDLMIWAVLMKRQHMALFMWQHGEEAMAKALMACKLYKGMAHEADHDDLEVEIPDQLRKYALEFQTLALELLEHCYKTDDDYTQQLLTYELKNFSDQTCLSLAVNANHREFIAHACCQQLLNDMWMGGLRMRKSTSLKVLLGIFFPPYILAMEFKSKEELQLMPQTMEEHLDELDSELSGDDNLSVSSFEDDQNAYGDEIESSFATCPVNSTAIVKENGMFMGDNSMYSNHVYKKKKSPLRLGKKIYEFYNAPITKFWFNTIFYFVFLFMYTYIVLGQTLPKPRWQEYYVMVYIGTLAMEKIRQIIASEPTSFLGKIKVFFSSVWNIWDTVSILWFSTAVLVRFLPVNHRAARVLYVINITFWYLRILEILSVNKYLGPYLKIIVKLLREMCYFLIILLIVVAAFGVVRQAIHYQDEEPRWFHVRNVFFYPYWMIYGELFADEIDTCTDPKRLEMVARGEIQDACVYGSWVAPLFMFPFLLMAIVLMVNLLIARFNATFIRINPHTIKLWKFQRCQLIVNYELRPILPPPLIGISHIYLALKFIKRRCQGKRDIDSGLKLFLSHDDMEKLHDFEEECAEDYFREKEILLQSSSDKRIQVINERVENMALRMDDVHQKENAVKLSLQTLDYRMSMLEDLAVRNIDMLGQVKQMLSQYELRSRNISSSSRGSSRMRLDSEDSGNDQLDIMYEDQFALPSDPSAVQKRRREYSQGSESDKLLTPEVNATMKSCPSPILVHSQKPIRDENLQKYTDFSKSSPKVSAKPATSLGRRLEKQSSVKKRRSLPKLLESSSEAEAKPSQHSLLERRHGNIEKLRISSQESSVPVPSDMSMNANTVMYSTAHMDTATSVSTTQPAQIETTDQTSQFSVPLSMPSDPFDNVHVDIPTPEMQTVPIHEALYLPKSMHSAPFTSILTSRSAEYTTITDEIDTSCMINRSPPRSPTSAIPLTAEPAWEDDKEENPASKFEKAALRHAEETEHKRMEKVIRNRLRQISMDESDSAAEIAMMVISEMETEYTHSDHEDDDDMQGSSEDVSMTREDDKEAENADSVEENEPITFEAAANVEIRIRRASTLDEDPPTSENC